MITASPYIVFKGEAEAALTFYQSVLGGTLDLMRFSEVGMEGELIMHGQLTTPDGWTLMASDGPQDTSTANGRVQICLWGDDPERLAAIFAGLADGGEVSTALEKQVWGDVYGDLHDRFGVYWALNIGAA